MTVSIRQRVCIGLALVSTMIAVHDTPAQEASGGKILLGPSGGFDYGLLSGSVPVYGGTSGCGEFSGGNVMAPSFGSYLLLPSFFGESLHMAARLAFSSASGEFATKPLDAQRIFDAETVSLVELDRELRLNSSVPMIGLDLVARYQLGERLSIGVGPSIGYRLSSEFTPTDNVLGPAGRTFAGGETERPLDGATALTASPLAIGAIASAGYLLPLGGTTSLLPEITLRAELTSPAKESTWQTFSIGVGASLLFDVTPSPAPPPPPPPVETPRIPALASRLELSGVDDDGQRAEAAAVRVDEVVHRRQSPLLPIIFFDSASSTLASRYVQLSPSDVASFTPNSLEEKDVTARYRQVLNVVGSRLRSEPAATITLMGMVSSGEGTEVAMERAGVVRDYLHEIWGIDESRIRVKSGSGTTPRSNESTDDGRAENRRVEFSSSSPSLMKAIVSEKIEQAFDPPTIRLAPVVQSEAGIKQWALTISQGGRVVQEFNSSRDGIELPSERTWHIERDRLDTSTSSLEAELVVEDNAGQTSRANASLPLVLKRRRHVRDSRMAQQDGRARFEYAIAGFNYNSSELSRQHESLIDEIAAAVGPDATITITGYTDRTGSEEHNASLSRQRAERIAQALRSRLASRGVKEGTIEAIGAGVETHRFGNDTPEGRMLSRGVSVVVEQGAAETDRP